MDEKHKPSYDQPPTSKGTSEIEVSQPLYAPIQEQQAEEHLKQVEDNFSRFERSTLRWTRATFGIVFATGLFICLQWWVMRGQLGEMRGQGEDTHRMTEVAVIQNRPWIGFESNTNAIKSGALAIDSRGWISTTVSASIKNFGNIPGSIPATVFTSLLVADVAHGNDAVVDRLNRIMSSELPRGDGPKATLFPATGGTYINTTFVTSEQIIPSPKAKDLEAFLVGGIVYTDPIGKTVHHTAFSYLYWMPPFRAVVFQRTPGTTIPTGIWIEYRTLVD